MSEFYQVDYDRKSPEAQQWERLNFILRQIFDLLKNLHGEEGPVTFYNPIRMTAHAITGGPLQKNLTETDFVTKSYLSSVEAGNIYLALLKSGGKTPLPTSGGGGGVSDHALLTHLDYASAAHTGFVPASRTISTSSPLSGGGNLGVNLTITIAKATAAVDGYLAAADFVTFAAKVSPSLTISTTPPLSGGGDLSASRTISISQATTASDGYLRYQEFNEFRAKTGPLSGTDGAIPKFVTASTLGDSIIKEYLGKIGINLAGNPTEVLDVYGNMRIASLAASYLLFGPSGVTEGGLAYTPGLGELWFEVLQTVNMKLKAAGLEVTGKIQAISGSILPEVVTITDASPLATNAALGNHFRVTLGASRTLGNPTNGVDGQRVIWEFTQDATGSRALTLDTKFSIPINMPDTTLSTGPGKTDMLGAIYNSTLDKWIVTGFMKEYS